MTPSYNQGRFIEETILSVRNQNYPNLQHIVVDNCSTDETSGVLKAYRHLLDHVVVEPDTGQSNALNKGFRLADGDILTWLNADDMLAPGALHQVARAFSGAARPDLVAGSLLYRMDDEVLYEHVTSAPSGPLSLEHLLDTDSTWMLGRYFYQPEVFFSRKIFEAAGGHLDETLFYSMDYDLWVRMAAAGASMSVIGAPLAIFRAHPDQKTSSPEKFLPELDKHAAALRARYGVSATPGVRRANRPLKLVFLSDVPEGGASIAHSRLRRIAKELGHEANVIHMLDHWTAALPSVDVGQLQATLASYEPDIVIVGNIHGVANAVDVLKATALNFTTIFYAHDMWLLTGRCAYTRGCTKLFDLCDHRCPTYDEYPPAEPRVIATLHREKLRVQGLWDLQVFANSRWMADNFDRLWRTHEVTGPTPRPLSVLPPVCDVAQFTAVDRAAARLALQLPPNADIVVCSANSLADGRKGYSYLLDAIEALSARPSPPLVLMVGWAHADLRARAGEHGNVAFVGHISADTAPLVYGAADILLSAALDEAFGMVYVEAAAAGARSVTFRSGGVADAIAEGVSGVLVDDLSGAALAEAVDGLLARKHAGEDLAWEPRTWAQAEHSDIAAVRRFATALAKSEPAKSSAFIRTQLHRRRSLAEATGGAAVVSPYAPVCIKRHTAVVSLGEVGYAVYAEAIGPDFRLVRLVLDLETALGPAHFDFKVIERAGELLIDLRPQESSPPIYSRALVDRGAPFFCDEWGPTLMMPLGSQDAMAHLAGVLPKSETLAFRRFAGVVERALGNPSIAANVQGAMIRTGFMANLDRISAGFRAWRG